MSVKLLVAPALAQPRRSGRPTADRPARYEDGASEGDASDFEEDASSPDDPEEHEVRPKRKLDQVGGKKGKAARRSRYVGVSWKKRDQKWMVKIKVRGVLQHLGTFNDEAEGARAYDAAVVAQNLGYPLNFPGDTGAEQAIKQRDNRSAIPDKGKSRFVGVRWHSSSTCDNYLALAQTE